MITVGKLISMLKFPPDFEFVYNDSDKEYDVMFPHFLDGMTKEFKDIILECPYINLIDFRDAIIELEGKMIYDELIARGLIKDTDPNMIYLQARGMLKNAISTDPIIDFNSLYPNILDSPE